MHEMIFRVESRRRKRGMMAGHAMAGVTLLLAGLDNLDTDSTERFVIGIIMVIAGGALLGAVLKERFGESHESPAAIGWVDIFAGIVLFVDGIEKMTTRVRLLPFLYIAAGIPYILLGIYHSKLFRHRSLTINDTGVRGRFSRFRSLKFDWTEISSIEIESLKINLTTLAGRRITFDLRDLPIASDRNTVLEIFKDRANGLTIGKSAPSATDNDPESVQTDTP